MEASFGRQRKTLSLLRVIVVVITITITITIALTIVIVVSISIVIMIYIYIYIEREREEDAVAPPRQLPAGPAAHALVRPEQRGVLQGSHLERYIGSYMYIYIYI